MLIKKLDYLIKRLILKRQFSHYVSENHLIQEDIRQNYLARGCDKRKTTLYLQFEHLMIYYPEFAMVYFWRIKKKSGWVYRLFSEDYKCKIFGSSQIQGGIVAFHPYASVINAEKIGKNFEFRNGTTIGNKNNDNSMLPTLGDNVTLGVNSCIVGNITIGNNVIVGAGAVVVKDIPDNCIVGGNPARIIRKIS